MPDGKRKRRHSPQPRQTQMVRPTQGPDDLGGGSDEAAISDRQVSA